MLKQFPARPSSAIERLASIARMADSGIIVDLRTHLDEWAAFSAGGYLVSRTGRQVWLNNPCPWTHHERLSAHMDWITPTAYKVLRRAAARDPLVRKSSRGVDSPNRLIVEHAVPVSVIKQCILADSGLRTPDALASFLRVHFRRGLLTRAEDAALNDAGLKQCMPEGWRAGQDPFARYLKVGLTRV